MKKRERKNKLFFNEESNIAEHWIDNNGEILGRIISRAEEFERKSDWNKVKKSDIMKDAQDNYIILSYPEHPKTKERRFTTTMDTGRQTEEGKAIIAKISHNKTTFIKYVAKGYETFFSQESKYQPTKEWFINILSEKYALQTIIYILHNKRISVKEFAELFNINEQIERKHLNKFEKEGLLISYKTSQGGKKYYKILKEAELREILNYLI